MSAYYKFYESHSRLGTLTSGFVAGFIAAELQPQSQKSRILSYVFNNAVETVWKTLAQKGFVKNLPYGECLVFTLSLAFLSWARSSHKDTISILTPLNLLEGTPTLDGNVKLQNNYIIYPTVDRLLGLSKIISERAGYLIGGPLKAWLILTVVNILKRSSESNSLANSIAALILLYRVTRLIIMKHCTKSGPSTPETAQTQSCKFSWLADFLPGLVAGVASLLHPSVLISQFTLSQAVFSLWAIVTKKKEWIIPAEHGSSIVFGLCSSILLYSAVFRKSALRPSTATLLNILSNKNFELLPRL